ncbi:MAG: formylglycine-generating enzyme family protein [Deltaproteobacteria bacterium]|nr:formylglycine-generating enzyme family protein [Deltaproteobacteria bacterium]
MRNTTISLLVILLTAWFIGCSDDQQEGIPDCGNRECGMDPVSGSLLCGTCQEPTPHCNDQGFCEATCIPDCGGRECGMDPVCGNMLCGTCEEPTPHCNDDGSCESTCTPDCGDRECGIDPVCGSLVCGTCEEPIPHCNDDGSCESTCTPDCGDRECGIDPVCGSLVCGTCEEPTPHCNDDGSCESTCTPDCGDRKCGIDPVCGSLLCGTCEEPTPHCSDQGQCVSLAEITWISIPSGTFFMGSESGDTDELPVHTVSIHDFEICMTEVTVYQYQQCVDAGACSPPNDLNSSRFCSWGQTDRLDYPVNCVDWSQASEFCEWAGGRLPSESEWEYAARSGGAGIAYPWGDEIADCSLAVMNDGALGCGQESIWPVCSKPLGNTEQAICDMAGNAKEWVQDYYHDTYADAPSDGSAWEDPASPFRVVRGGDFSSTPMLLRSSFRDLLDPSERQLIGFRCAR